MIETAPRCDGCGKLMPGHAWPTAGIFCSACGNKGAAPAFSLTFNTADAAILSRLRDDSAAGRFKTVEEFRSWVLGVDTL